MSITKPSFPNPSVALSKATLEKLEGLVKDARGADGAVDVQALAKKVASSSDAAVKSGFDTIKDAFTRTETVPVSGGCGSSTGGCGSSTSTRRVEPKALNAGEVMSVLSALVEARSKIDALDANHDGKLQAGEVGKAAELTGLRGKLVQGAVDAELKAYRLELSAWRDALGHVARSVDDRKSFDAELTKLAKHHAATPEGEQAILWAYRDLATLGSGGDVWKLRKALEDAETSFLKHIPFFGRHAKTKEGHLSDAEVKSLLQTDDLSGFASAKQASAEARVHMSFADYLAGKDLDGAEQLSDPDFQKSYHAGC